MAEHGPLHARPPAGPLFLSSSHAGVRQSSQAWGMDLVHEVLFILVANILKNWFHIFRSEVGTCPPHPSQHGSPWVWPQPLKRPFLTKPAHLRTLALRRWPGRA